MSNWKVESISCKILTFCVQEKKNIKERVTGVFLRKVYFPCHFHCMSTSYNFLLDIPSDNHHIVNNFMYGDFFIFLWKWKSLFLLLRNDLQKGNRFIGLAIFIENYVIFFIFCTSELILIMGILFLLGYLYCFSFPKRFMAAIFCRNHPIAGPFWIPAFKTLYICLV